MLTARIIKRPPFPEYIKQLNFGTAKGLTETAKEAQAAVVGALRGAFTLRGNWFQQSNRFGIKITPARKDKLQAEVKTAADWLRAHEEGGDKKSSQGHRIAVPAGMLQRTKRGIVPRRDRPTALRNAGAFIIQTKKGPVLAKRFKTGKRKGLTILYGLEQSVRIRKQSTFYEPIRKVVDRRLAANIRNGIKHAFATAR